MAQVVEEDSLTSRIRACVVAGFRAVQLASDVSVDCLVSDASLAFLNTSRFYVLSLLPVHQSLRLSLPPYLLTVDAVLHPRYRFAPPEVDRATFDQPTC